MTNHSINPKTSSAWLNVPSPAKLNLMLHITGQREDGYHELQTIFQFVDYGDELRFQLRNDNQITLSPEIEGVDFEDNLIHHLPNLYIEGLKGRNKLNSDEDKMNESLQRLLND